MVDFHGAESKNFCRPLIDGDEGHIRTASAQAAPAANQASKESRELAEIVVKARFAHGCHPYERRYVIGA